MRKSYIQCKLQKDNSEQIVWLPNKNIISGCSVELLPQKEFWKVIETYTVLSEEAFKTRELAARKGFASIR